MKCRNNPQHKFAIIEAIENNKAIAGMLYQIAALQAEQGIAFKPAAYRRAAQVIEELPKDVSTYGDKKALMELPGIGEAIAEKILEYLKTGKIETLQKLLRQQGGISAELMSIEDLGPKRVRQIQTELGITTTADLIKAAQEGKLRSLPRFSEKMEKKILEKAGRVTERNTRFPRKDIVKDVEKLLETVRSVPEVERCEAAGSYRREKETIGDVDIVVVTKSAQKVSDAISKLPIVRNVVAHGGTKLSFDLASPLRSDGSSAGHAGLRVDIRFVKKNQWGSALLYFTGSKDHNIVLRKRAISKGWKLNEYALAEGEKIIAQKEEADIYKALDLRFYEPNERTEQL